MASSEPRALWLWLHRYVGLAGLIFLGLAALTGCIMCFIRPLDAAINADLFRAPATGAAMPVALAVDRYQARHPELYVRSFPLDVPVGQTIAMKVEPAGKTSKLGFNQVFLDRGDGHVVGSRMDDAAWTRRGAMKLLHDLHYTLLAGDPGKWLMAILAFTWLVSNIIGAYLTLPLRPPFWRSWRRMWRFRLSSSTPRIMLDVHRSGGLWLLLPLTALAFTSVALNLFTPVWQPAVEALLPSPPSPLDMPAPYPKGVRGEIAFVRAIAAARTQAAVNHEPWLPATGLYNPKRGLYGVQLTDDGRLNYRRLGPINYYFDGGSGAFVAADTPYGDPGLSLIRMLYTIHSGRVAGPLGVAVVFVLGVVTVEMCVTGVYIWWTKRRAGRRGLTARKSPKP